MKGGEGPPKKGVNGSLTARRVGHGEKRWGILASQVGTMCEPYDYCLIAVPAPAIASSIFPPGNETAALLPAFAH